MTGLRPDRNGIVENTFQDPAIPGATFSMSNREAVQDRRWWDQGEPIWVTAERAGILTAPAFWPGSEAPIRGVRPTYFLPFDKTVPSEARADQTLSWLDLPPARRPRFLTLYIEMLDTAGHDFGPDAPETMAAIAEADAAVGRLLKGLEARGLDANLVIVADHGMASLSPDRRRFIDDVLPQGSYRFLGGGAFMAIYPTDGQENLVAGALLKAHDGFRCWAKADIPARFHYGKNPRVAPFFCLADNGWALTLRAYKPAKPELGNHGFDPYSPDMAAIFIASGPAFRRGVTLPAFDNVSVYPLLARLIDVKPAPNDGRLRDVQRALTR